MKSPQDFHLPITGIFRRPEGGFALTTFAAPGGAQAADSLVGLLQASASEPVWSVGTCDGGAWFATAACVRDLVAGLLAVSQAGEYRPNPRLRSVEAWGQALAQSDFNPIFGQGVQKLI
jgi:hypothetical protein